MFGICFFDLVPETYEMGGVESAFIMFGVWIAYSAVHSFHLFHHHHDPESAAHESTFQSARGFYFFLGPLIAHGLASGMLLAISHDVSTHMAGTVFAALIAHKAYESLLLASILVALPRTQRWKLFMIALYALALPIGTLMALSFRQLIDHRAATWISSIAVGTLLGCLVFDFMLPSLRQLKQRGGRTSALLWMCAGLVLTRLFMMSV